MTGRTILGSMKLCTVVVFAVVIAAAMSNVKAHAESGFENFDFESVGASVTKVEAGSHPDVSTVFHLNGDPSKVDPFGQAKPWGSLRHIGVELPVGMTGNPEAFPKCSLDRFSTAIADLIKTGTGGCPADSQVGIASPGLWNIFPIGVLNEPLYNLESPGGDVAARLGFYALATPILIDIKVDSERGDAVTAEVANAAALAFPLTGSQVTTWGAPTEADHDRERYNPLEAVGCAGIPLGSCVEPRPSSLAPSAFMSNPTNCGPQEVGFLASNYPLPDRVVSTTAFLPETIDCEKVPFAPTMSLTPTAHSGDSSTGLDVALSLPQAGLSIPSLLATAHLKDAVVTMPEGLVINPSAADGLDGCSEAEIGLLSVNPIRFNAADPECPDSSKVGTATIVTPILHNPLEGSLYVAKQGEGNPFGSLLSGYLVAKGKGVIIKVAGRFDMDSVTGRITATFSNSPQQPFSNLKLHFTGGGRGVLATPLACGNYESRYELTPWSGMPPVVGGSPFIIDQGCGNNDFKPSLSAGTTNPVADAYAPFVVSVTRQGDEHNVADIDVTLPPGELAKLAKVPVCGDAQASSGDCPAESQIGVVNVAVGSGSLPLWLPQPNRAPTAVYLGGPYKGAPYSLVVKVPAQAGPFDLGTVVTRAGIYVDQESTQVTVKSDPLPQILEGVPVRYRTIHVDIDRPDFALNPTNCETMAVTSSVTSDQGETANPSSRFQVGGCGELGFKPKLSLKLSGKTNRGGLPKLRAVLKMPKHGANIGRAVVALPHSEFLEQGHINTVCTRVQFAAEECPAGAVYGHARAFTPLLDQPLEGPVYLRSSGNRLPDLVADLRGQIHVVVDGRIDSVNGGIRTTFAHVPDAPVSKFVLTMQGGSKGLLVNSEALCRHPNFATAKFSGQNGKARNFRPVLRTGCGK